MAKKTPLSFLIEVQSKEALKKLEEVEQKLGKLKDGVQIDIKSDSGTNLTTLLQNIATAAETITNVKEAIKGTSLGSFTTRATKAVEAINALDTAFKSLNGTIEANEGLKNFMTGLGEVIRAARAAVASMGAGSGGGIGGGVDADARKLTKSLEQAKYEYYKIENLIQRASNASSMGKLFGDTSKIDEQIRKLEQYKAALDELRRTGKYSDMDTATFRAQGDYKIAIDNIKKLIAAQEKSNQENVKASAAAQQAANGIRALANEEGRLWRAVQQSTDSMRAQSSVLGDLKSLATQYLGVWGAQQFIHNIIQIGGQLEQQRLSIGAILGDLAAGNHLFDQIKGLALQSPFGVVELDKYTKQLSAYGFKQSELFDMTKRLADISAGAGTEVSRLALALGHVRSEGALTGYTLRQFAMNNIPMLQKLSERLSEVEGRIVSTSEIRKRVSKKEIGYEDVIAVIKDLTDEGGMFYNMQEVMSDAVSAKFKNLKDSMDIMYGEMAEGKLGDALKTIAQTLMTITRNWEASLRVIGYATAAWTAHRLAIVATNKGLGQFGFSIASTNQKLMAQRIIFGGNKKALKGLSAGAIDLMVQQKLLTKEQLLNAVASKRLTVAQAELAAANFGVSRSELTLIASTGRWRLMLGSLATSIKSVGIALKGMLLNPFTIAFGAITAGLEIYSRWKQKNEEIAESIKQLGEKGADGYKNMSDALSKLPKGDTDRAGQITAIDDIKDQLQNYAPDVTNILNQAAGIEDLGERYEYLRKELELTRDAYAKLQQIKNVISDANQYTGDLVNDTMTENAGDYIKSLEKVTKAETAFYKNRASIDQALKSMNGKKGFVLATDEKGNLEPLEKQIELIKGNIEYSRMFSAELLHVDESATIAWTQMNRKMADADTVWKEVLTDIGFFTQTLDDRLVAKYGENWKQSASNVKAAWLAVQAEIDKVPGMTDEVRRKILKEIFNKTYKLNIDFDTTKVEEELPKWMQALQDELDKTGIFLKADMSYEQIVDAMKQGYDTAQTTINKLGPIAIKAGIKLEGIQGLDIEKYKYLNPELYNVLQQLQQAATSKTQIESAGSKRGLTFEGMKKDGSHKEPKKTNTGEKKDTLLEKWREEFNELKAFYSEYKRWAELVGKDKALQKIQEQGLFGTMFSNGKPIYNISQWGNALDAFLGKTNGSTSARSKFQTEVKKEKSMYLADQLKEELEKAGKSIQEYISQHADQFNLFKQIMDKTGDKGLAEQAFKDGRIWNDAARSFEDKLKSITGGLEIDYYMSDKDAKEYFKQIAGGYDLWKKIVDLTRDNYVQALTKASDAVADSLTNQQKIANLQNKIREAESDTESGIDHAAEIAKWREEINKLESEMFEFLPIYEKIFGDRTYKGYNAVKSAENLANTLIEHAQPGAKDPKTGKTSYYSTYYMDGEEMVKVTMTRQQLEKLKKTLDNFHKDEVKKNPFATLVSDIKELYDTLKDNDATADEKSEAWRKFGESLSEVSKIVGNFAGELSSMFDALGNDSMAEAMSDVQAGMDSVNNIASGFAQGGIVGGIVAGAGEAVKWIGRIAQKHDAKLDKAIQKSQREVKKLTNEYKNLSDELDRRLSGIYGGEEYTKMFENYSKQLTELEKQRQAEIDKKKTDDDKVIDYDQQIKEMRDNIKYFAEDMAKDLYDIDVKSWAQELTDAVVDAWAKGEDAAEAWHDKVLDLVKDVTKNIIAQKVVEAALKPVLDFITDEMTAKGGRLDEGSITQMAKMLEEAGMTSVGNIEVMLEALKRAGYDLSEAGKSSSSASSSIKNITEETADLLVSYVNAIRADVSVIRELQTRGIDYISEVPTISITAQAQLQQLNIISENTRRNADYANEINDLIRGLRNGVWRVPVA